VSLSSFGEVADLTSAQIMFLAFAGMEDARIKAGGGPVERSNKGGQGDQLTVSEYAKMRRGRSEMKEYVKKKRADQKEFRAWLNSQVKAELVKEMRYS